MRAVFLGTPEFAVPSLRALASEHNVVAVFTQPDRPKGRGNKIVESPVKQAAAAFEHTLDQLGAMLDIDNLTDPWILDFAQDDPRQGQVCDIKQVRARFTAACGPAGTASAEVPVSKKGDRLSWAYQSGAKTVRAEMKLISSVTMKGTLTSPDGSSAVVLHRPLNQRLLHVRENFLIARDNLKTSEK